MKAASYMVLQNGFQETDIVSVVKPLVKYAVFIREANRLRYELEKAIYLCRAGRHGPVLLDVPIDIQRAEIDPLQLVSYFDSEEYAEQLSVQHIEPTDGEIHNAVAMLKQSARPTVLVGGGLGVVASLRAWLELSGIPVVCSLMGLDAVSSDYAW